MKSELRQSIDYVQFFSSLGGAAVVSWIVWELVESPAAYNSKNAQLQLVNRSTDWFGLLIDNLPLVFVFIAGMGTISITVYKSQFR